MKQTPVKEWLQKQPGWLFSLYAIMAAFSTYACMYVYRRAYTAAGFEGLEFLGMELKTVLIISQVLGYTISKFLGIKIISEMTRDKRGISIIILILIAHASLLLFWLVPLPYSIIFFISEWFAPGYDLGPGFQLPGRAKKHRAVRCGVECEFYSIVRNCSQHRFLCNA
jgi:hypothetical protein